jgi:hypothetical protein
MRALMIRLAFMGVGAIILMYVFFRKPVSQYAIGMHGELIPMRHPTMGPMMYPPPRDQFGNVAPEIYATPNSNPFRQNPQYNQYNPYNEYYTQNPNKHPYSPS